MPVDRSINGCGASGNCLRAASRLPPCMDAVPIVHGGTASMWEFMTVTLAFLAVLIEAVLGYPDWLFRAIGHPVTWMGRLVHILDRTLNRVSMNDRERRAAGIMAILVLVVIAAGAALFLEYGLRRLPFGFAMTAILASSLIAQRSLFSHVQRVAQALEHDGVAGARQLVTHIVGRDTDALDEAGVSRAAIESLAENF